MYDTLPLAIEIILCFILSIFLLYRYADFLNHNSVTIGAVLVSWFFSFLVIFLLPADLTSTAYRRCILSATNGTSPNHNSNLQASIIKTSLNNDSTTISPISTSTLSPDVHRLNSTCDQPWNYVGDTIMRRLWRLIYWSSQFLTWIVLPLMQSYSMTGEFNVSDRFVSAVKSNIMYYTSFLVVFLFVLVFLISKSIPLSNIKQIIISSANTWGLFILVVLLGYGLIELPRSFMNKSLFSQSLSEMYFKVARANIEKCEAESELDEVLEEIQKAYLEINDTHHLRPYLMQILSKCPPDWKKRSVAFRRQNSMIRENSEITTTYSLKSLAKLHSRVKKSVQMHGRIIRKWNSILLEVIEWEDVAKNQSKEFSSTRTFVSELPRVRSYKFYNSILPSQWYTPQVEWYWKCFLRVWLYRISGGLLGALSVAIVWSEFTFLFRSPVLSIFALFTNGFEQASEYFMLELFSILSIGYLASCAFYTVFHMKIFNIYHLASNHQTDEYSLVFSGSLLCRLAAPLCINYLCLVHRDIPYEMNDTIVEPSFISVMGHFELIPFISNALYIILPLCISSICLALYFNIGTLLLHYLGFEQYIPGDESTTDLVHIGRTLVNREKAKLLRALEGSANYNAMNSQPATSSQNLTKTAESGNDIEIKIVSSEHNQSPSSTSSQSSKSSLLHKSNSKLSIGDDLKEVISYSGITSKTQSGQQSSKNSEIRQSSNDNKSSTSKGLFDDI